MPISAEFGAREFYRFHDPSAWRGLFIESNRATHGRQINDTLCINDLKHMDEGEDGFIFMDLEECALGAILKAVANYVLIADRNKHFIKAFLAWVRLNLDPKKYNIHCDPNWKPSN